MSIKDPLHESNITEQQSNFLNLKNQGYTKNEVVNSLNSFGFSDNAHQQQMVSDIDTVFGATPSVTEQKQEKVAIATAAKKEQLYPGAALKEEIAARNSYSQAFEENLPYKHDSLGSYLRDTSSNIASYAEREALWNNRLTKEATARSNPNDIFDTAADVTKSVTKGALGLINIPVTLTALATGGKVGTDAMKALKGTIDNISKDQSILLQQASEAVKRDYDVEYLRNNFQSILKDSQGDPAQFTKSLVSEMGAAGTAILENPLFLLDIIGEEAPSFVTGGLIGKAVTNKVTKNVAEAAAKKGASKKATEKFKNKVIDKGQEIAGGATSAIEEASAIAAETMIEIAELPEATLEEKPEYIELKKELGADAARKRLMTDAGIKAGLSAAAITAVVGKYTGASKRKASSLTEPVAITDVKNIAKGAVSEGSEELIAGTASTAVANTIVKEDADSNKNVRENLGIEGAAGALAGGSIGASAPTLKATGDAVRGTAKAAVKAKDSIKQTKDNAVSNAIAKADAEVKSVIQKSAETEVNDYDRQVGLVKGEKDLNTRLLSSITLANTINNSIADGKVPESKKEHARAQVQELKSIFEEADKEITTQQKDNVAAVKSEDIITTAEQEQGALSYALTAEGTKDDGLINKLSGSKHITPAQKELLKEVSNPNSVLAKRIKNRQEVRKEIFSGGEGFTGIEQHLQSVTASIAAGDKESTAYSLIQLRAFNQSQARKVRTGKFADGNKIPEDLMTDIKDESKAIDTLYRAMTDSANQAFDGDILASTESVEAKTNEALGKEAKGTTTGSRQTVPHNVRKQLVGQALSKLLNVAHKGAEGTSDSLNQNRLNLASKHGINSETIGDYNEALRTVERIEGISKTNRTDEDKDALRQANEEIDGLYSSLLDNYGSLESLSEALIEQGDSDSINDIIAEIPAPVELDINFDETKGHEPISKVTKELSTTAQLDKHNTLVTDLQKPANNVDLTSEQQTALDSLEEVNALSANTKDKYNAAVSLANELKLPNATVSAATGESKATATTPKNRTFLNTLEDSPLGSALRSAFKFIGSKTGLLQVEEDMVSKLSDTSTDIYKHLTKNMSTPDKEALAEVISFLSDFEKGVNKTVVDPDSIDESFTTNADFINDLMQGGQLDSNMVAALGLGMGSWFQSNGTSSQYNDDRTIAKILNKGENYRPTRQERDVLKNAGVVRALAAENIGSDILRMIGWTAKGSTNEAHLKQLKTGLGLLAIQSAENSGSLGMIQTQYVIYKDGKVVRIQDKASPVYEGETPVAFIKTRPTSSTAKDPTSPIASNVARYIKAADNSNITRDILGATDRYEKIYTDGEVIPSAANDSWNSPEAAEAIDINSSQEYTLDNAYLEVVFDVLDDHHRAALIDIVPPVEEEHVTNSRANQSRRDAINDQLSGLERIVKLVKDTATKTLRYHTRSSKRNKRIDQLGTDGSPQNQKLVRHAVKLVSQQVELDPTNKLHMLAFKMAVTEALDVDSSAGKSTDKSTDAAIVEGFEALLKDKTIMAAVDSIKSGENDQAKIQAVLTGAATAIKLDGLLALAQYSTTEPFKVFIGKENDGITNGIAIGLKQLAAATDFQDYVDRLARTGIFVGNLYSEGYGQWGENPANQDSYLTFSKRMTELLTNLEDNPYSKDSSTPVIKYNDRSKFFIPAKVLKALKSAGTFEHTDGKGNAIEAAYNVSTNSEPGKKYYDKKTKKYKFTKATGKWTNTLTISKETFKEVSGAIDFFLEIEVFDEDSGEVITLKNYVDKISRNFAKDPLMIFNYGAGLDGLKASIAGAVFRGITGSIEQANKLDTANKELAFKRIEDAVGKISPYSDKKWRIDRESPLTTPAPDSLFNDARLGVEFTYGAAMERAFDEQYGVYKKQINRVIATTRVISGLYAKALDRAVAAKKKETGRDYLTVDERKEVEESLKEHAPMIATAMSDDRRKDGIWIPKGESTTDTDSGNPEDIVKLGLKGRGGSNTFPRSATFSDKIIDPGVSMGAILVQSLDAATIVKTILKNTEFVNVHDAGIFSLLSVFSDTKNMNEAFNDAMDYSLVDALVEVFESVESNPLLTDKDKQEVFKDIKDIKDLFGNGDFKEALLSFQNDTNSNRALSNDVENQTTQYNGGTQGIVHRKGTKTAEDGSNEWIDINPPVSRETWFTSFLKGLSKARASKTAKDFFKIEVATKYIGKGKEYSSTDVYDQKFTEEGIANTGKYTSEDIVFVSANGKRSGGFAVVEDGVLTDNFSDVDKAIDAGATFVSDSIVTIEKNRSYNVGDSAFLNYIIDKGYTPIAQGKVLYWMPSGTEVDYSKLGETYKELKEAEVNEVQLEEEAATLGENVSSDALSDEQDEVAAFVQLLESYDFNILDLPTQYQERLFSLAKSRDVEYASEYADGIYTQETLYPTISVQSPEAVEALRDKEERVMNDALRTNKVGKVIGALFSIFPKSTKEGKLLERAQRALSGNVVIKFYANATDIHVTDTDVLEASTNRVNFVKQGNTLHVFGWKNPTKLDRVMYAAILDESGIDTNAEPVAKDTEENPDYKIVSDYRPRTDKTKAVKRYLLKLMADGLSYVAAKTKTKENTNYADTHKTVFGNLDKKIMGSSADADNLYSNYASPEAEERATKYGVNNENAEQLFTILGDVPSETKPSKSHLKTLSKVLSIISPTLDKITAKLFINDDGTETSGFAEGASSITLVMNTGAKVNNIEMSPQEAYVHELTHTTLTQADKSSFAYKQIEKLHAQAVKHLTVEHFLGEVSNPTPEDYAAAKARYDHTLFNNVEGGGTYETYLGNEGVWHNADPVEEFAVMAATNEAVGKAIINMQKGLPVESKTFWEKLIDALAALYNGIFNKIDGYDSNNPSLVPLLAHIAGAHQQKQNMVYRSVRKLDTTIDDTSAWIKDKLGNTAIGAAISNRALFKGYQESKDRVRSFIGKTTIGKNKLAVSIANELTAGRKGLAGMVRLLTKSTYEVERRSEQIKEIMISDIANLFDNELSAIDNKALYKMILNSDVQSLTRTHSNESIQDLLTNSIARNARIDTLVKELQEVAPSASRYMASHARDLGYNMVTGERLYTVGMYTNAYQIANMWGYSGKKGSIDSEAAEIILDELATLHALEYAKEDIRHIFTDSAEDLDKLEAITGIMAGLHDIALDTTFADNAYNMRKGYIREKFDSNTDVTTGTDADHNRLVTLGYTRVASVQKDPSLKKQKQQYYYVSKDGAPTKYLTGIISLNSAESKGVDLFQAGDNTATATLTALLQRESLEKSKSKELNNMFKTGGTIIKGEFRNRIAEPLFDSVGNVKGYRYSMSAKHRDEFLDRDTDFGSAIGHTLAGINRRNSTVSNNKLALESMHKTYKQEYSKFPHEFITISKNSSNKRDRDAYNLLPDEAKAYAQTLWGDDKIRVRQEQFDIVFGYRKLSVSQLRYDTSEQTKAYKKILQLTNNLATLLFNNSVGISVEKYWQAFVTTAKDTIVIKSGVVTAANIASNILLLWWSGVPFTQAVKDHVVAYKATFEYREVEKELYSLEQRIGRIPEGEKRNKALGKRNALRQKLYNNPVRDLMEAGMFQTIVDDVDVGENVTPIRDRFDTLVEPIVDRIPSTVKTVAKNIVLTHDTKAYKVMRDVAQISDFAARYSLHKHNLSKGMDKSESFRDISATFINYDIPTHRGIQYMNDVGLMGFTKYLFRVQYVLVKRFGENPARVMMTTIMQSLTGTSVPDPSDAALNGIGSLLSRFYSPFAWVEGATETAPINLMTK